MRIEPEVHNLISLRLLPQEIKQEAKLILMETVIEKCSEIN